MKTTRFKDFRCFGGWLTVIWKPKLIAYWSSDAAPPDRLNTGFYLFGRRKIGHCD